jgi:ATP-dependent DNA helicase RecQ
MNPTAPLEDTLHQHFGFTQFRKGQRPIIQSILKGDDTLAVMPTGGGKSLCYQYPALAQNGLVIVISPLIALMKDQVQQLQNRGVPAGCLHSGQERADKAQIFQTIKTAERFLLYLSPERVQNPGFAHWVKKQDNLVLFAIDEAHCVSQWGPDFREDYNRLSLLRELRPDVPILALTATATPEVLRDISKQLQLNEPRRHVYGFYRPNLYYQVEVCQNEGEKKAFLQGALASTPKGRVLIYCGTRKQTEELALELSERYDKVSYYHAGLPPSTRQSVQGKMAAGDLRILTATNAFGMGIDYPDVRLVIHYQMPANIESFYQEMGRAGRDGEPATCLMLYAKKDKGLHSFFIQQSDADPGTLRRRWNGLDAIVNFAEGGECRHSGILTYFKDSDRIDHCGHCDVCAPHSPLLKMRDPNYMTPLRAKKKAKVVPKELILVDDRAKRRHDQLKEWRKAYAKKNDIPAFMVFSNKTLLDLANKNPQDLSSLEEVYGFGPVKVEQLGADLLQALSHSESREAQD